MMTLNLLPPDRKKNYAYALLLERSRPALIIAVIIAVLGAAGVQAIDMALQQKASAIQADVAALRQSVASSEAGSLSDTVTQLNQTLQHLETAVATKRAWAAELRSLLSTIPADAPVSSITVTSEGVVTVSGTAKTRAAFLSLDDALKKSTALSGVATTSTASRRDNIPYVYTARFTATQP